MNIKTIICALLITASNYAIDYDVTFEGKTKTWKQWKQENFQTNKKKESNDYPPFIYVSDRTENNIWGKVGSTLSIIGNIFYVANGLDSCINYFYPLTESVLNEEYEDHRLDLSLATWDLNQCLFNAKVDDMSPKCEEAIEAFIKIAGYIEYNKIKKHYNV